jgi:methanethiol S-methyltransferase
MNRSSSTPPLVSPPSRLALVWAWGGALVFAAALGYFLYAYLVRFGRPAGPGPALGPGAADLALFSAFAAHHSLFARTPLKTAVRRWLRPPLERSFYTWVASCLFLATCLWWQPVPGVVYALHGWTGSAGFGVQIAGVLIVAAGSRAIDVLDLAGVRPILRARSEQAPHHVPLMTTGAYRIVRHPVYLGWALFVFGAPTMTATRAVFAIVSTAYLAVAIPWEERSLVDTFGSDYEAYRQTVRWRMLPFIY